jgi:hypothetical protein
MMTALWIALGIALTAAVLYLSAGISVYLILAWIQAHK